MLMLVPVGLFNIAAGVVPICVTVGVLRVGSADDLGLLMSVRYVPLGLVVLFGGIASEHMNRKNLLRWALIVSAAGQSVCAAAFGDHALLVLPLVIGLAVSGLAAGFVYPAFAAEVAARGNGPRLRTFNSAYRVATTVGTAAGAAVGGALVSVVGVGSALLLSASLVTTAVLLAEIQRKPGTVVRSLRRFEFTATVQALSRKWFVATLVFTGSVNLLWTAIFSVSLPILMGASGGGVFTWTWVLTANSAGFACGGVIAGMIRPLRPLQFAALCLLFVSVLLALFVPGVGVVGLCLLVAFLAGVAVEQVNLNVIQTQQERGRNIGAGMIASADLLAGIVTSPLGFLVGGFLVTSHGGSAATLLLSGGVAIVSIASLLVRPWRRTMAVQVEATP